MTHATSTVSLAECTSYDIDTVRSAVTDCLDHLADLRQQLNKANRVLLKPNLLSSRSGPDEPVNTHPAVVRVVSEILSSDFDCDVAIGDSCGSLSRSSTQQALENSGMDRVARETGAEIYNVDQQPREVVPFPGGKIYTEIPLPSNLSQFDLILSLPKLKTHHLTAITCAVKNLLGLVPGAAKKKAHLMAPRTDEFASLLCDLFACLQPDAALVDAIVGMEGGGPNNGSPREMNFLAASTDLFALDSVCARAMALDPTQVLTLREGAKRGLGQSNIKHIDPIGAPLEQFVCDDYQPASSARNGVLLRLLPRWMFRGFFESLTTLRAAVDQEACILCEECARNCPSHAIDFHEDLQQYRVDPDLCITCYCCDEVCPADAIRMERAGMIGRILEMISG